MIHSRYRLLKKIRRTGVAVLHCPGCVLTSNLCCHDIFTSTRLWLLPITGVAKNLGSSSLLSSFAGGETCNWRCFTVNWTTLHTTGLADMAQATPSHGPGLQLSPCDYHNSRGRMILDIVNPSSTGLLGETCRNIMLLMLLLQRHIFLMNRASVGMIFVQS